MIPKTTALNNTKTYLHLTVPLHKQYLIVLFENLSSWHVDAGNERAFCLYRSFQHGQIISSSSQGHRESQIPRFHKLHKT